MRVIVIAIVAVDANRSSYCKGGEDAVGKEEYR
jgi:hypothetical protein